MRVLLRLFLFLMLLVLGAGAVSLYSYRTPLAYAGPKTVIVPAGSGVRATLAILHQEGVAPRAELLLLPLLVSTEYKKLKAGEYEFASGMSPAEILAKMIRGEVVVHKITIPEGWNSFQLRDAFVKEPLLTGDLPVIEEGSVLPDTMHFERGEAREKVVARMRAAQEKLLQQLWPARAQNLPFASPQEALILASIVEKETGVSDERAMVAGVFINRLRKGMMLQTDPSVAYGIEVQQNGALLGRALSRVDLAHDTAYNTYTRAGLPPTPICNPGKASIEAVLNPAATDALYFVATGSGGHHFAATLKEHNANVAAYRRALKEAAAQKK